MSPMISLALLAACYTLPCLKALLVLLVIRRLRVFYNFLLAPLGVTLFCI